MERRSLLFSALILLFSSITVAVYLVADYYVDPEFPRVFGQVCGKTIQDDCLWLNSHLNTFGIADYGANRDCVTTLDASDHPGSMYKLKWTRFKLESGDCSRDYLELYDAGRDMINSSTNLIGRYCGSSYPNTTGYPTQQFLTFKWHTDGDREDKGFRVMATRNLPYPCFEDFFHCKAENRCIDGRLKCDGIEQCDEGEDESSCTGWEKFIGAILALGTAGIVGVCGAVLFGCLLIGCIICAVTCCRKPCGKCWKAVCKPFEIAKKSIGKKLSQKDNCVKEKDDGNVKEGERDTVKSGKLEDKAPGSISAPAPIIPVSSAEKQNESVNPSHDTDGSNRKSDPSVTPGDRNVTSDGRDAKLVSSGLISVENADDVTKIDT